MLATTACGRAGGGVGAEAKPEAAIAITSTVASSAQPTAESIAVGQPVIDPGDGGDYRPALDPARIAAVVDNPYLPFRPGSRWVYEGEGDGEVERIEVVVTERRRTIMGIAAVEVRDTVTIGGDVVEDTFDWYAQDLDGNVWYLGEDVKDYDGGKVVSTAGSWQAGVGGALPGVVMPAVATVGTPYRQEYLAGEAEDMMVITAVGGDETVAAGTFGGVVVTHDWTPLDPVVIEEKAYAAGVGKIREQKVGGAPGFAELVEFTPGV